MVSELKHQGTRKSQRHDEAQARREQIVDEAMGLIGQKGYHGLTIDQLAKQCGLTKGGVIYHFPSKDHVLIAVVEECTRRDSDVISRLIAEEVEQSAQPASNRDTVLHMLRVILGYSSANPDLARLLSMLQLEAIDPAYPAHELLKCANRAALERYTELLSLVTENPLSLARRVSALMSGLTQQWLSEDREFDIFEEWDRAITAIIPDALNTKAEEGAGQ